MKISAKAEYACLAIIELARDAAPTLPRPAREIAEAQGISEPYLVQILLRLKAAGLVQSARGAVGGYQLARDPESITVAEVISAIDGPGERLGRKGGTAARALIDLLIDARAAEQTVLTSTSIADLAGRVPRHDWML
jgi:Rrf2 family cysteine metabolism transcriptional repressor